MSTYSSFNNDSLMQTMHESLKTIPQKGALQGNRKLTKGRSGKRIVFFPSRKNKGLMPCESRLEADNCLHLEFDKSVTSYRTQPFTIDLGGRESYTPDSIHIDQLGNFVIREVKFSGALESEKLSNRLDKIGNIFSQQGLWFHILTENDLQLPPKINNYKLLYRCSHQKFDNMLIEFAISLLEKLTAPCSLKDFRHKCNKHQLPPLIADTLIFLGFVSYDESEELTSNSIIWKAGGKS